MVEVPGSSPVTPTTVISFRHPLQVEVPGSSPVTPTTVISCSHPMTAAAMSPRPLLFARIAYAFSPLCEFGAQTLGSRSAWCTDHFRNLRLWRRRL